MTEIAQNSILIYDSKLPIKVINILDCMGLAYLSDIQLFTSNQLLKVTGLGKKSVKFDIEEALIDNGMSLSNKDTQSNEDKAKALKIINEYNNRAASRKISEMKADEVRSKITPVAWGLLSRISSSKRKIESYKIALKELGYDLDELNLIRHID